MVIISDIATGQVELATPSSTSSRPDETPIGPWPDALPRLAEVVAEPCPPGVRQGGR